MTHVQQTVPSCNCRLVHTAQPSENITANSRLHQWSYMGICTSEASPGNLNHHISEIGYSSDYDHFNDEDYLDIADLSDLSDEDIAAPMLENSSSSQRTGNRASSITEGFSSVKASCAETITSNEDAHLQNQSGTSFSDQVTCSKDDCLQLPGQADMGFDYWFSSLDEETSVFGSPNLDMESFLLNNVESSFDNINTMQKAPLIEPQHFDFNSAGNSLINGHREVIGNSVESDKTVSTHISEGARNPCKRESLFADTFLFPVPGRARSKRSRSLGKACRSSMMLWGNGSSSPTDSLESKLSYLNPTLCTSGSSYLICNKAMFIISGEACNEVNIDCFTYKNGWLKVGGLSGKDQMLMHDGNGDTVHAQNVKYNADDETDDMNIGDSFSDQQKATVIRRCTHCFSHKTPQWRAGPAGPKTLCNACGVRFKSGRLFDEYRPAKSPTFLSYKHSNSHKRVLEMRCKKGLGSSQEQHHICLRSRLQQCQQHQNSSCYSASASSSAPSTSSMKLKVNINANAGNIPVQRAHPLGITFYTISNPSRLGDA